MLINIRRLTAMQRAVSGAVATASAQQRIAFVAARTMATDSGSSVAAVATDRLQAMEEDRKIARSWGSGKGANAVSPYANDSFVPPPLPEHKYDPVKIAQTGVDLTKYYQPKERHAPGKKSLEFSHLVDYFASQNPTPTNPSLNPTTLTQALRSSQIIYPKWTPKSKRVGVIAQKIGMSAVWDGWGNRLPMTIVRLIDNQIIQVKNEVSKIHGTIGMQVGAGYRNFKTTNKSQIIHCLKAGVMPKAKIIEFPITTDAVLPLGTTIGVRHFVPGQYIDVVGRTKGKGTQGVMYKWGFGGQPASHGVSVSHRSVGSVGSNTSPGRVLKGKKMPGRMGNNQRTYEGMRLYKIDTKRNLLYIKGSIPGPRLGWIEITDAKKKKFDPKTPPPFPTYFPTPGTEEPAELVMPTEGLDPNAEAAGL